MDSKTAEIVQRHGAFWRRESVDRPILSIQVFDPLASKHIPLSNVVWGDKDLQLQPEMFDARVFAEVENWHYARGKRFMGDSFSIRQPYVRVPWIEGILGCSIWADRDSGSIWSEPFLMDLAAGKDIVLDPANGWYRKLLELTRALEEVNDGSFAVSQTLMRGPIDMVRAVLGDQELCLAVLEETDAVRGLLEATCEVFIAVAKAQQALVRPVQGGYMGYYGIWAPGTVVRTQCDMSALLSPNTYRELVVPYEQKVCRPFQWSMIHLHSGFLHTVDALLEAEFPHAIQICLDTGSTPVTTRDAIEVGRKVLERKSLILEGEMSAADLEYALATLPARGLYVLAYLTQSEVAKLPPALREYVA